MPGECDRQLWRGIQPVEGIRGIWPARNAVRVTATAYQMGVGNDIAYTVPAGKILFITTQQIASRLSADSGTYAFSMLYDAVPAQQDLIGVHYYNKAGQNNSSVNFVPAVEVVAGWSVRCVVGNANLHARVNIYGWIEDA